MGIEHGSKSHHTPGTLLFPADIRPEFRAEVLNGEQETIAA